jgi:hypothetical protein
MNRRLVLPAVAVFLGGAAVGVPAASAAPTTVGCPASKPITSSVSVSPHVLHAGRPLTQTQSLENCSAKWLLVVVTSISTPPKVCGKPVTTTSLAVLQPHSASGSGMGTAGPTCLGKYTMKLRVTLHGKLVSSAATSFTVIK